MLPAALGCNLVRAAIDACGLLRLQEDDGAHVLIGSPLPVAQEYRVDHQPSLALTKQEVSDGLRHQATPRKANEDRYWVNMFADERNGVGNGDGPRDLPDIVVALLLEA